MATRYWVGGTGTWDASSTANWSASTGGASGASAPTSADTVIFDSLSGTGTCTTASGSACAIATLNSSTLGLTLGANHTMSGAFTLTLGALALGSFTLSCFQFSSSNSNIRTINFGTGNITITGNSAIVWTTGVPTNLTYVGTPTVNATYSGATGTRTFAAGLVTGTQINVNIPAGSDIVTTASVAQINNLNFTGFTGTFGNVARSIYGNLTFSSGMTCTAGANATTLAATSGTQQITTNGVTLDFPITQNGVGGTVQLQDNLTMGSTRTYTLTNGVLDLNNLTLSAGIFSSSNANVRSIAFGTGNITLTGNAATIWSTGNTTNLTYLGTPVVNCTYSGSTGTRTLATGGVGINETNCATYNISAGTDVIVLASSTSNFKNLNFTGFAGTFTTKLSTIYGNLTVSSGMTCSATANAITFAATSGTQQITTAGNTLDFPLTFNGIGGTFAFQDALTQGATRAFTVTNGTVQLKNGVTSTVGAFTTSGTNQKYLQSTTAGFQATMSQASGTVNASYLTIQDINATGGATWNARTDLGSKDITNNTGWNFIYIAIQQILKPIMEKILKPIILN